MADTIAMGRLIRESRLKKGMSLGQLAEAVGRSSSSVRRWERGEVPPAAGIIDALASALDLDPDELRGMRPTPVMDAPMPERPEGRSRPTTIEQPVAEQVAESPGTSHEPREDATALGGVEEKPVARGFLGEVWAVILETTRNWSGWIRGLLTAGVLLVLLLILIWAMGELFAGLGEVWDSFDIG